MTLEQALIVAVASLAGVVTFLFGWFRNQFNLILSKLSDCEEDREALWRHIAKVTGTAEDPPTRSSQAKKSKGRATEPT